MKILVSACLLGKNCKYSGGNNYCPQVEAFLRGKEVLEVCPEVLAGLPVPREPIELVQGVLMDCTGRDADGLLRRSAGYLATEAKAAGVELAILQPRSPTCGVRQVYDGSFSGRLISGSGVFVQALLALGIPTVEPDAVDCLVEQNTDGERESGK